MSTYVEATGTLEKLDVPILPNGFTVHVFLEKACALVDEETSTAWVSGDFVAMRAAEYVAAGLFADANYGMSETGRQMRARACVLLNILDPKWCRNENFSNV